MKNRSRIILLAASVMLSVSVMAMANEKKAVVKMASDHPVEISKIGPLEGYGAFSFQNYDSADLVQYDLSFERNYTLIEYVVGKVQNKALPLSKKLWLFNCQIALK